MFKYLVLPAALLVTTVTGDQVYFNNAAVDRDTLAARFGGAEWVAHLASITPNSADAAASEPADDGATSSGGDDDTESTTSHGVDDMRRAAARIHDEMVAAVKEAIAHNASAAEIADIRDNMGRAEEELITRSDEVSKRIELALQTAVDHGRAHGMPEDVIADLQKKMHAASGSLSTDGTAADGSVDIASDAGASNSKDLDEVATPGSDDAATARHRMWHGAEGEVAWQIEKALAIATSEGRKHGMGEEAIAQMTKRMRDAKSHAQANAPAGADTDDADATGADADTAGADADAEQDWGVDAARTQMYRSAEHMQAGLQRAIEDARARGAPEDAIKRMTDHMERARSDVEHQAELVAAAVERAHREQLAREEKGAPAKLTASQMDAVKDAALEVVSSAVAKQAETPSAQPAQAMQLDDAVALVGARTGLVRLSNNSAAGARAHSTPVVGIVIGVCALVAAGVAVPAAFKHYRQRRAASGDYVSAYSGMGLAGSSDASKPLNGEAHV